MKAGRGAVYTAADLARLEKIQELQSEGLMLAEIGQILEGGAPAPTSTPAAAWWQHVIEEDVMVWVRTDASPWRMKQVRTAIDEMASRLKVEKGSKGRSKAT